MPLNNKITNHTQTVFVNNKNLQVQNIPKTIQQHRAEGNVYSTGGGLGSNKNAYIHNPIGSGVKMYIYSIIVTADVDTTFTIYKCDNVVASTSGDNVNLKFDSNNTSKLKWDKLTVAISNGEIFETFRGSIFVNDYKESFIQLTEGTTICITGNNNYSFTMSWIETAEDI